MRLLYIVGIPGSGKTELVRQLVLGRRRRVVTKPFAHTVYEDGLVQLGRDRQLHGGTDALSMAVQPQAVAALEAHVWPRVLAEGDRLANVAFFKAARSAGYGVTVAWLRVPNEVAAERRAARGTNQDPVWLAGRESKVKNLVGQLAYEHITLALLDGTRPSAELAAQLATHPVLMTPSGNPTQEEQAC